MNKFTVVLMLVNSNICRIKLWFFSITEYSLRCIILPLQKIIRHFKIINYEKEHNGSVQILHIQMSANIKDVIQDHNESRLLNTYLTKLEQIREWDW